MTATRILFILLTFLSSVTYSSTQSYIQGNTSDSHFKNYIPFVTINVYDNATNNLIGSTQSNSTGEWSFSDTIVSVNQNDLIINEYNLSNAYPNPFNPSTNIIFDTKKTSSFNLEVFNIIGQKLYNNSVELTTGSYQFNIAGFGKAGIYFFRISNSDISLINKLVLLDGGNNNNITVNINNSTSIAKNFAKISSSEWKLEFYKSGYISKDTIISIPNYDMLNILLNQNPRNGNMNLSGQLTAQPTQADALGTSANVNGTIIPTTNGFWESDLALSYITNQADTTNKVFTPSKVDLEFSGENYFSNSTSIDAALGNTVVNSDINQKQISKNATANISIVDENGNAISGSSVKIYKASNDSLMFSGSPGNITLSYSGFDFDNDATFNNIGQARVEGSANGYVTNSNVFEFSNPMSSDIVLAQGKKNITVTGQVIDDKFGTVVQNDVTSIVDVNTGDVYATDDFSGDGINITATIPELSDVQMRIINNSDSYSNKFFDISEESQNLGNITRNQNPVAVTMTGQGNVVAKPTNATPSNVTVNFAGNNVTTNNGSWSSSTTIDKYVNPVNSNDKKFEPSSVSVSWSGTHYESSSQNVSTQEGTKTINKDLQQTTYSKTASLEALINDGSNPVSGANVTVKNHDNGSTLKTGTTGTDGKKSFSINYNGYEFDDDATFSNISSLDIFADATNYNSNSTNVGFSNPMSAIVSLTSTGQLITITGQTLDNKFGTRVQNDVIQLKDKNNATVYSTDNNSADGIRVSATVPIGRDVVLNITNSSSAYNNQVVDISEQSQNINVTRNQNPTARVMNLSGNVTLDPTGYTSASDVNVAVTGEGSTTTQNGSWSRNVDFSEYVNPVNSSDKLNEPSAVTVTWSGPNYTTSSSGVSTQSGSVTKNKTLSQTRINATADLEVIVNDGSNPVSSATVVVKNGSTTLNNGSTNSSGVANFDVPYTTFRYASNPITFSNIANLLIQTSKTDYESNSKTITFADPMNTTITIEPIAGEEHILDTYFRLYETDGDVVSSSNLPNIRFEWNGEIMTVPNVNGKAHIYKVYTGSNPESNVTILPPSGDYLGTMALTTVNSSKVERLAQSANQASGMDVAVSTLNATGDEELYLIPGTWQYAGGNLDADGSTVQQFYNRHPLYGVSGHRAVGPYPKTLVLKGTFHKDTGEQVSQSFIDVRDAQIDAYLAATQMPHKKLLNYEVKTFSSWTDPNWTNAGHESSRGANNITWAVFGNADRNGIELSFSDPEKYKIFNSNSTTTNSSTPANRMSEWFGSVTATEAALGDYVTNPSTGGTITNVGDNIIGITYIFKPGTRIWQ